jgi:DNA-binding transcriptional regulator YdaS (Cro superfamily)
MRLTKLSEYLLAEKGRTALIARDAGLAPAFLSQIACGRRPAPPTHCPAIETATFFAVRRWDLRPDDWHRIWPELVGEEGAPMVPVSKVRPAAVPEAAVPVDAERAVAREFTRDVVQREVDRWTHGAARPSNHRERKG